MSGGDFMANKYSQYAKYMKALSDETRVRIFAMLSQGELCACHILDYFKFTQPTLSYHMKVLGDSGLIVSRREGVWVKYSINRENLKELLDFLEKVSGQKICRELATRGVSDDCSGMAK